MSSKSRQLPAWMAQKPWRSVLFARCKQYVNGNATHAGRRSYASWATHLPRSLHSRALNHPLRPPAILYPGRLNYPAVPIIPSQHLHYKSLSGQTNESTPTSSIHRPSKAINIHHPALSVGKRQYIQISSKLEKAKEEFSQPPQLSVLDYLGDKTLEKAKPSYIFTHAATGFPKSGKRVVPVENDEQYASVQVGEDAYFRRYDSLGVADGVGGWTGTTGMCSFVLYFVLPPVQYSNSAILILGANPALYSRKLMHYAYLELERFDNIDDPSFYDYDKADPVEILQKSYEHCLEDAEKEVRNYFYLCLWRVTVYAAVGMKRSCCKLKLLHIYRVL